MLSWQSEVDNQIRVVATNLRLRRGNPTFAGVLHRLCRIVETALDR